jgi:meiotically up-regulated gene 157 (Mug157) protein
MMFSSALNASSLIMSKITPRSSNLTSWMRSMATNINRGINDHALVPDPKYGMIYAYEIDGYGSVISMDDPNVPSLLSAPFIGYTKTQDPIYSNTRRKILSRDNPYFAWGPVISGVGSMHTLPGKVWPMANLMTILTSEDEEEIATNLGMVLGSTGGTGLVHESVDAQTGGYSRSWFSWANGLLGQVVLSLEERGGVLERSYQ